MKRQVNRELLKQLMKEKGTQPVEDRGVSIYTLRKMAYEEYASDPKEITIQAICDAYEVSSDDLFPSVGADGGDAA